MRGLALIKRTNQVVVTEAYNRSVRTPPNDANDRRSGLYTKLSVVEPTVRLRLSPPPTKSRPGSQTLPFAGHTCFFGTNLIGSSRHYLGQRNVSLADITYLLGFSDQSNFFRAARRWFNSSPRDYRIRLLTER